MRINGLRRSVNRQVRACLALEPRDVCDRSDSIVLVCGRRNEPLKSNFGAELSLDRHRRSHLRNGVVDVAAYEALQNALGAVPSSGVRLVLTGFVGDDGGLFITSVPDLLVSA